MVHALEEIRRVLVPAGVLVDLRPLMDRWPVEVVSMRGFSETGRVDDFPEPISADVAANAAMSEVESRGWFRREQEDVFPFFYSWDTPSEMEAFVAEDWPDVIRLSEDLKQATRSTWALGDADCRVRLRLKMLITRWQKLPE